MSAPPYQKLFWGSYHKHTAHLGHAKEHGAYLLLIGALWNNEGRLPADDVTLAGYAKLTVKEWEAIKPKLINGTLLKIVRGKLTQPRVTEDLAKYRDTSGKRKEAGKTGGTVSAEKKRENRQAIATALPTKPEPEPKEEIETPIAPKGAEEPALPKIVLRQADVEAVWEITPPRAKQRTSKADILKALQGAARRGHSPAAVIAGLIAYYASAEATKDGGEYAKGAHRMITADRWQGFAEAATPLEAIAAAPDPLDVWRRRVNAFRNGSGFWNTTDWEAQPGRPGCIVPTVILLEFDIQPATPQGAAA